MSNNSNNTASGGIGFTSLLLIAFIVLKLCNVINWSWWWVLSPFWIPAGIALLLLGVIWLIRIADARKNKKVITKSGQIKSKWQERLDEMQAAKAKAEEFRTQNKL